MIVLDFVIYYLTKYFEDKRYLLSWSTPIQRSCYAIGIASGAYLYSLAALIELGIFKNYRFKIPALLLIIIILFFIKLYGYIYEEKNRYQNIDAGRFKFAKGVSDKSRYIVSAIFVVFSILSIFLIYYIFHLLRG
jgi:hypothetical protein